ncbi:MAG: Na+/H+ antiporter subunit E [Actinobacteria bacterium]|nr:Na+/H+ antiporter subunit E [Actinomycetota bacterium]
MTEATPVNKREVRRERRAGSLLRLHELPLLLGLLLTWMLLWREFSWLSLVSGVVVSIIAMRLFYLPPVILAGRFNAWWALRYLGYFLWHLALASVQVAWLAIKPGPPPRTAIIAAKLRTRSDFVLTLVSLTISLIPGSLVVEVDRFGSTLYLHVLNTPTQREIRLMRAQIARIERLLVRTLGSRAEVEAMR